ncbi:MAG: glycine zipper 2TM domain-containing protein, partial [Plesiomonas sp.]
ERNTTIGAATGAVVGHVLTDGSTLGTAGGAVVGGMIGHSSR